MTGTLGTAAPLASLTLPKITLVAVCANAPELSATRKTHIIRKWVTVNTSSNQFSDRKTARRMNTASTPDLSHHPSMTFARTIDPQRILVHDFVPAPDMLLSQKAFQDLDFEVDAVNENASGIAHRPVGAEDKPILAKGPPQKLQSWHISRGVGDGLELH